MTDPDSTKWYEKLSPEERRDVFRLIGLLNLPHEDQYLDLSAFLATLYIKMSEARHLIQQANKALGTL